jgi:hypothetical protein
MSLRRLPPLFVVAVTLVFIAPGGAFAAVHWQPETAVYFDVWEKGKAECEATYFRTLQAAQARSDVREQRVAIKAAKQERSICRRDAKARAHAAFLQARKDRRERLKSARKAKNGGE